ncbi:hypothetical protein OsJ_29888 [Oryza sativa Japonica Group]|uniref:Uncharacterized protein n=1 Tax=Oryza sativa subsp. japonica TaxID=39947 RepID=A3C0A6_ORYSJ|nr:hypothetical protein OsJ_29888 [Oryza sativa Japonica Group]
MGEPRACKLWLLVVAMAASWSCSSMAMTFTIANYCSHPIWPGTLAGAGTPQLSTTGFRLDPGQTAQLAAPAGWSGRIWARTGCVFDADGAGVCQTGDCGGRVECRDAGAAPPATLFEVTLREGRRRGLLRPCPRELQVECGGGGAIACRSACEAFGQDRYCCAGEYGTPAACRPTAYSAIFKTACPRAYSYAYDDSTSTFTCKAAYDYTIAFCLPTSGINKSDAVFLGAQIIDGDGGNAPPAYRGGGGGGGGSRPPIYYNGGGGAHEPETMTASSASTRCTQPWLLLLLLLLLLLVFLF